MSDNVLTQRPYQVHQTVQHVISSIKPHFSIHPDTEQRWKNAYDMFTRVYNSLNNISAKDIHGIILLDQTYFSNIHHGELLIFMHLINTYMFCRVMNQCEIFSQRHNEIFHSSNELQGIIHNLEQHVIQMKVILETILSSITEISKGLDPLMTLRTLITGLYSPSVNYVLPNFFQRILDELVVFPFISEYIKHKFTSTPMYLLVGKLPKLIAWIRDIDMVYYYPETRLLDWTSKHCPSFVPRGVDTCVHSNIQLHKQYIENIVNNNTSTKDYQRPHGLNNNMDVCKGSMANNYHLVPRITCLVAPDVMSTEPCLSGSSSDTQQNNDTKWESETKSQKDDNNNILLDSYHVLFKNGAFDNSFFERDPRYIDTVNLFRFSHDVVFTNNTSVNCDLQKCCFKPLGSKYSIYVDIGTILNTVVVIQHAYGFTLNMDINPLTIPPSILDIWNVLYDLYHTMNLFISIVSQPLNFAVNVVKMKHDLLALDLKSDLVKRALSTMCTNMIDSTTAKYKEELLKYVKKGEIINVPGDGNCLLHSIIFHTLEIKDKVVYYTDVLDTLSIPLPHSRIESNNGKQSTETNEQPNLPEDPTNTTTVNAIIDRLRVRLFIFDALAQLLRNSICDYLVMEHQGFIESSLLENEFFYRTLMAEIRQDVQSMNPHSISNVIGNFIARGKIKREFVDNITRFFKSDSFNVESISMSERRNHALLYADAVRNVPQSYAEQGMIQILCKLLNIVVVVVKTKEYGHERYISDIFPGIEYLDAPNYYPVAFVYHGGAHYQYVRTEISCTFSDLFGRYHRECLHPDWHIISPLHSVAERK